MEDKEEEEEEEREEVENEVGKAADCVASLKVDGTVWAGAASSLHSPTVDDTGRYDS